MTFTNKMLEGIPTATTESMTYLDAALSNVFDEERTNAKIASGN